MNEILCHNVVDPWPFTDKYFHTICCSPPYWALRNYGVAARKLGRNFMGLELNPKYIEIAQARLKKIRPFHLIVVTLK